MTATELVKQMFLSFSAKDSESFVSAAREYIEREKRKKHNVVAKDLEQALYYNSYNNDLQKRFKSNIPIPRDNESGFPLLEIQNYDYDFNSLIMAKNEKDQLELVIREFKDADILATYNLEYKKKILLCGKPGTGKTFSAQILSSILNIPLVYVRFDAIISSYLGETAGNLRKIFDFIESGTWIVLFDEFDIIGKNRDDSHEHGEIKRVVNNFLQMLDNYKGDSILVAATNHQNILDSAIWRRFDDVIYYNLPDKKSRKMLFQTYLKSMKKDENIDLDYISEQADGLSHSDIKMITQEAIKIAIINSRNNLSFDDIKLAVKKFSFREKVRTNQLGN